MDQHQKDKHNNSKDAIIFSEIILSKMKIKNQIMLENALNKYVGQKDLPKSLFHHNDILMEELTKLKNNGPLFLGDSARNINNIFLFNDNNFRMHTKSSKKKIKVSVKSEDLKQNNPRDETTNDTIQLKVTCSYKSVSPTVNFDLKNNEPREYYSDTVSNDNNEQGDLQSLLIMMALSNKPEDIEYNDNISIKEHEEVNSAEHKQGVDHDGLSSNTKIESSNKLECADEYLLVKQLKIKLSLREKYLLRKYVLIWKKKIVKKTVLTEQRQEALDKFLEGLTNKKKKLNQSPDSVKKAQLKVHDYKTYQHRYKVQKHIIALQREKLEHQNRLIEELKYNKVIEASHQSLDALKDEVRKTYYEIDRHLKPKIKCMTNELKIQDIEEPALVLHCLKMPQFLQRMEKRAREREERHAMIRERRRQMEEERARLKQQADIERALLDNEEKAKKLKEAKEKRKKEKIENIRKKQLAERMRALTVMADLFYEKTLLTRYGIIPFQRLLCLKQQNIEKAKAHYVFQLKKNVFLNWMFYTEDMNFERNFKAENLYRKKLLKKVFNAFKSNHREYVLKVQVADDYYDLYVQQVVFRKFREAMEVVRLEYEKKWQKAAQYYNSILLFKTFTCWRSLPAFNALKREQEARKARWRAKVLQVVPDYTPPED